jgi:phospholipid transport system substrate-binding protein
MRGIGYLLFASALLLAATPGLAQSPPADPPVTARAVIEGVMHDVLAILRDPKLTTDDKAKKVRQIADDQIDFLTLSRLTMGHFWRDLSDAQHADFLAAFKEHVAGTYEHIIVGEYVDEDAPVTGDRAESRGDFTVQTRIVGKNPDGGTKEIAKVDYRMRQTDGRWKIIDVTIDGVSLAANFRAQFQEIMTNGGFDQLLKQLREKNIENENPQHG